MHGSMGGGRRPAPVGRGRAAPGASRLPDPKVVFRNDDNGTVQSFASTGLGVAIMSALTIDFSDPAVTLVPLEDMPPRVIGAVWHRDRYRSAALDAMIEHAQELCTGLAREVEGELRRRRRIGTKSTRTRAARAATRTPTPRVGGG